MTPIIETNSEFFVVGGTVPPSAPSYVARGTDDELLLALERGEYAYVLNSRQMGKSSLCVRTLGRLRERGVRTLFLDLTKFGARNLSPEQWYVALLSEAGRDLGCRPDMLRHWKERSQVGPMQRFFDALAEVALVADASPLVVFVDEIDVTRSLPFNVDEFFAGIRQCFVARATDPAMMRLSFCLLGTATPTELIQDTRTSPFNIGRRVDLRDFTTIEAKPLVTALGSEGRVVLDRVLYWTNGHPYLTQRLCREAAVRGASSRRAVDSLCNELFLSHTAREGDDNLAFVRNRLLKSEVDTSALLDLVGKLRGKGVLDEEGDPVVGVLKMSGIARLERGRLVMRNRIYERVFDLPWIESQLPGAELRRQKDAYRRGLKRSVVVGIVAFVVLLPLIGSAGQAVYFQTYANGLEQDRDTKDKRIEALESERIALALRLIDGGGIKAAKRLAFMDYPNDAETLVRLAQAVLASEAKRGKAGDALALIFVRRAVELKGTTDLELLKTYARLLETTGDKRESVRVRTKIAGTVRRRAAIFSTSEP